MFKIIFEIVLKILKNFKIILKLKNLKFHKNVTKIFPSQNHDQELSKSDKKITKLKSIRISRSLSLT